MDDDYDDDESGEPSKEELTEMRKASPADAAGVDALILSQCSEQWRKVAMVVGESLDEFDTKFGHLPYVYLPVRILELEKAGKLDVQGDVYAMRASEIRLRA